MKAARYDISSFVEFGQTLNEHGLKAQVLPSEKKVEISDQFGNKVKRNFSDVLLDKVGCTNCIRKIVDHFDKLRFHSMRGVKDIKVGTVTS